jgi:hypothetical protein
MHLSFYILHLESHLFLLGMNFVEPCCSYMSLLLQHGLCCTSTVAPSTTAALPKRNTTKRYKI